MRVFRFVSLQLYDLAFPDFFGLLDAEPDGATEVLHEHLGFFDLS